MFVETKIFTFKIGVIMRTHLLIHPRGQKFQIEQILSYGRGRHLFPLTAKQTRSKLRQGPVRSDST
jgi:hypothetical protein